MQVVARNMIDDENISMTIRNIQPIQPSSSSSTSAQVIAWPQTGSTLINQFTTEGYITCAFPTLLPTGAGDVIAPRQQPMTVGNYFKHLLTYGDGQFAKHPRFRYFALNTEMRWHALQTGIIYIKHKSVHQKH